MIALAFSYTTLHSWLSTSRLALTSPSPCFQFPGPRDCAVVVADSESSPSTGSRWAEAWAEQGLSEQLSARLLCWCQCLFFFLHFTRCLCPAVKRVGCADDLVRTESAFLCD